MYERPYVKIRIFVGVVDYGDVQEFTAVALREATGQDQSKHVWVPVDHAPDVELYDRCYASGKFGAFLFALHRIEDYLFTLDAKYRRGAFEVQNTLDHPDVIPFLPNIHKGLKPLRRYLYNIVTDWMVKLEQLVNQ